MIITPIPGAPNWDVPLNAALNDLQSQATSLQAQATSLQSQVTTNLDRLVYLVDDHSAVGDGTTDDKTAIQALLTAAPKGATVLLGRKRYALASGLTIPPYVTLAGPGVDRDAVSADGYPALVPKAGFTGVAVINLQDKATGGYATENRDVHVIGVNIDGVNLTTETVTGIRATGFVHGVVLRDVGIANMTNHSIDLVNGASGNPYSWNLDNVQVNGSSSAATTWDGFRLIGTDHVLTDCRAEGVRGNGFYFNGLSNTQVNNCRSEWSAVNGFYVTGSYGTGQGSGGIMLSDCSTDRNSQHGVLIDSTGNGQVIISGLMARRDGRNGFPGAGGGGFAALRGSAATTPIVVTGMTCYPGVGDDGLGTNSPERGASFTGCTWAAVTASYLHADLTPFHDGGTNAWLGRSPNTGTATGTTAAPVRSATEPGTLAGPLTITQGGIIESRGTATNTAYEAQVAADTVTRWNVNASGTQTWGPGGSTARDTTLGRGAANRLDLTTTDLRIATAGRGLQVAEGSNAKSGTAVLVAGAVTVANTSVTANSRIQLTSNVDGGTPGFLRVSARTAATSFTITSSSGTDTSTVAYLIIEP